MNRSIFILLIFLLGGIPSGPLFSQEEPQARTEEEVYLSFRYEGVIDEIVVAYYDGTRFYLPFTELFDIFAINYELSPQSFAVSGYYLSENKPYKVDFSRREASIGDKKFPLSADDFFLKQVDYFLTPNVFQELFDLNFTIDLSRLVLRLETEYEMPIVTRRNRRSRDQIRSRYGEENLDEYILVNERNPRILDGAFLDYSLFSVVSRTSRQANLNIGLGGELLYGDLQGNILSTNNQDTSIISGSDIRWRYVQDRSPWFTTTSLGQQSGNGLVSQTFQGLHISNEPIVPKRSYDNYVIEDVTEADAEIELYQNNRLVETIRSDKTGYYRFLVPLSYGTSDFKIRIYGKQGRIIELDQRIQIPFNFLPRGDLRYHFNTGRLADAQIPWSRQTEYLQTDVSFGFNNWITAGIGAEYVGGNNEDRPVFYGKISTRVAGDVLLGLDLVALNYYQFSSRGVGRNSSSWSFNYTAYDQQNIYNVLGYKQSLSASLFRPFQWLGLRHTGRSTIPWVEYPGPDRFTLTGDVTQFMGALRFNYGLREQHTFTSSGHVNKSQLQFGTVYTLPRVPSIHPLLRGSYFRTDLNYSTSQGDLEEIRFQYIKQFNRRMRAQLLSTYDLFQKNGFFEVGVTLDLEPVRSTSSVRSLGGTSSFTQTLRGSVGLDRNNQEFLWDNRQQVGRAGVSIKMFVDDDNSGTWDEGEEIIPGNAVTVQHASTRQITKSGISRLTQLQPYRQYYFLVNEAKISNPMLMARHRKFSIIADPNRFKQLDIPFFTSGVIDGRVDRSIDGQQIPISGLRIHLKSDDGSHEATLRTFADGSYYSMEVPPGDYELWVDEAQLEFLGMISVPERLYFTVEAKADGDFIEGLNFLLE